MSFKGEAARRFWIFCTDLSGFYARIWNANLDVVSGLIYSETGLGSTLTGAESEELAANYHSLAGMEHGNDWLDGGDGNDTIYGNAGVEHICEFSANAATEEKLTCAA